MKVSPVPRKVVETADAGNAGAGMGLGHEGLERRAQGTRILSPPTLRILKWLLHLPQQPLADPHMAAAFFLPTAQGPGVPGPTVLPPTYLPPTERSDTA